MPDTPRRPGFGEFEPGDEPDLVFDLVDDEAVGPWPGRQYPEDMVEEGLDLPRVSGGHARPSDHLNPSASDIVLVDFTKPEPTGEVWGVVQVKRDGVPIRPIPLGIVRATNAGYATIVARMTWNVPTADMWLDSRDELVASILRSFVAR